MACLMLLGIAASCGRTPVSKLTPISPDNPDYCDHCPCNSGRVNCPGKDSDLCTLSSLWASQRGRWEAEDRGFAWSPTIMGAWACGRLVVVEELCGTDCLGNYAYDAATGQVVASRNGGGVVWTVCEDGYRSNWSTQPPSFRFPERKECTSINLREVVLADAGAEPGQ
jgi:hypothetical protein